MSVSYQLKKYVQYKLHAVNEHSIHSPFVYALYTDVIKNINKYPAFNELNTIRKQLLQNTQSIQVVDLGAGSKRMNNSRPVKDIAKYSIISKKYGELLFKLLYYFKPKQILELGTSLGISALYMSKAASQASITSIEGCPNTFSFANKLIKNAQAKNIHTINASFDDVLTNNISDRKYDFVFIDGNHTYDATLRYFNCLLKNKTENTIIVFDDIYWTADMTRAWEEIKSHADVTLSIDLYKMGLIFFRKENKQKEHFCLRY